jgi:hypothetical protein
MEKKFKGNKNHQNGKGRFAEEDFMNIVYTLPQYKNTTVYDVRYFKEYQDIDIDFVIDKYNKNDELPDINNVIHNKDRYELIEVKFNSPAIQTGYLAFELISHARPGWGALSKCDTMYFVFGDIISEENNLYTIKKRGLINFEKWKLLLRTINPKPKLMGTDTEGGIRNLSIPLATLENNGVIKYI